MLSSLNKCVKQSIKEFTRMVQKMLLQKAFGYAAVKHKFVFITASLQIIPQTVSWF